MSENIITIKANKHRVLQVEKDKKMQLLLQLIAQNPQLDIVVASAKEAASLQATCKESNVRVIDDTNLLEDTTLSCELLISYDLPEDAEVYIQRVSRATQESSVLVAQEEQKDLYPIEMLLRRALKQTVVQGFEYQEEKKPVKKQVKTPQLTKEKISSIAKKRFEDATLEKVKETKDENIKARVKKEHKDFKSEMGNKKRKTPAKVGKKISIKARKPKEDAS